MAGASRETIASRGAATPGGGGADGGLPPGTVVAGYRIEARAGAGGMGVVYRAVEPELGRTVALKIVAPRLARDDESARALIAEARAAAALEHPNAVPVYRAGEDAGRVYIAMRYIEGESLDDRVARDGPLAPADVVRIVGQVADALDAAHALGLVHGDVKPANVLLGGEPGAERAYLTDFGLATRAGAVGRPGAGTPAYLAPEQIRRRPLDGRADVYALGCLIVHCLTGRPPYPGPADAAVLAHLTTAPPRPSELAGDLPPAVDAVVARALAKRPADRHPTAGDLARDLAAARFDLVLVHPEAERAAAEAARDALVDQGIAAALLPAGAPAARAARVLGAAAACALVGGEASAPAGPTVDEAERRGRDDGLRLARTGAGDRDAVASLARLARGARSAPPAEAGGRPPYRGLAPFTEEDADVFHGRSEEVAKALAALDATGFVAIIGSSGSGKSSLLRAGLVAALARGALPGSEAWTVAVVAPGAHPARALAAARPRGPDAAGPDLLVVDQLEEAYTLCRDRGERAAFLDAVADLAAAGTRVAVAVRADFYGHLAEHPGMRALVQRSQVLLGPLTPEGLRAAVEEPAARAGLELEPGLLPTILGDVGDRPAALPLLQHVLLELWERRRGRELTLEAYAAAGGVGGALARHGDAVLAGMDPADRATARRVLLRLVQPGDGAEDTRRRATVDELAHADTPPEDLERVLATLSAGRLVTLGRDEEGGGRVADLAHEALIREWPTLRGWIDEEREALARRRQVADATREWEARGRDEELLFGPRRLAAWEGRDLGDLSPAEREFLEAGRARAGAQAAARRRRVRLAIAGLSAAVVAISVVAALALWQRAEAADARDRARDERAVAVSRQLAVEAARERPADPQLGLLLALAAWDSAPTPQAEVELRQATLDSRAVAVLRSDGPVQEAIPTPDGEGVVGIGEDGTVRLWDVATREVVATTRLADESLESVAATPDGTRVAVSGGSGRVWVLELPTLRQEAMIPVGHGTTENIAWGPGGRLATAHEDGTAAIWRPPAREPLRLLRGHTDVVRAIAWDRDGRVVTSSTDGTVRVRDPATGRAARVIRTGRPDLRSMAVAPDGAIVVGSMDSTVSDWPARGGTPRVHTAHQNELYGVAVSPDARWIASAGVDSRVLLWDRRRDGPPVLALRGHRGYVYSAWFDATGRTLVTAGQDGTVRLWDVSPERIPTVLHGATKATFGAKWTADGETVLTGSQDTRVRVWDAAGGPPRRYLDGSRNEIYGIDLTPDGRFVAAADIDGGTRIWDVRTGRRVAWINRDGGGDVGVAFSPDGTLLVTAGFDTVVRVWEWRTGRLVRALTGHTNLIWEVAFAPDGRSIASGGVDATARVWDWPSGRLRFVLRGGTDVGSLDYRPDATEIATSGGDGNIRIWRVADGRQVAVLTGHSDSANQVRWTPDGRMLASVGQEGTARIWSRETGATLAVVGGLPDGTGIAPAPDSRRFLIADGQGVVRIIDCEVCGPVEEVEALARRRVARDLTPDERERFLPATG